MRKVNLSTVAAVLVTWVSAGTGEFVGRLANNLYMCAGFTISFTIDLVTGMTGVGYVVFAVVGTTSVIMVRLRLSESACLTVHIVYMACCSLLVGIAVVLGLIGGLVIDWCA